MAVKVFERERRSRTLRFDFRRCADSDEARLSQLALWALECERRHLDFEIVMPDTTLSSRKETVDAILTHLALY
jgi:hypothetical protein